MLVNLALLSIAALALTQAPSGGLAGAYVPPHAVRGGCVLGPYGVPDSLGACSSAGLTLQHFPMGGNFDADLFVGNYFDLDPSPGVLDWNCTNHTYDGHEGIDAGLRTFDEQVIGVPVFAAADGVVVFAQDGFPDMNTMGSTQAGNIVAIDHGGGCESEYFHLRKNSVSVSVGQSVVAGQPIGFAGSSGNSYGPHLHFGTSDGGVRFEPSAGACDPGQSLWHAQVPIEYGFYVWDFALSRQDLTGFFPPFSLPRSNQVLLSDPFIYFWVYMINAPANGTWRVEFQHPNGSIDWDSGTVSLGNPVPYQWWWTWWQFDIPGLHQVTGTWHVRITLNGQLIVSAPLEVLAALNPNLNHVPEPISVALDPPAPAANDAVYCRVATSLVADDLDWDIVRYHYVWKVNGQIVRDVTTAGHADAVPRGIAQPGDLLACEVTPEDGKALGSTASASAAVGAACATPAVYCTAKTNSLGCVPAVRWSGRASATASSGFEVAAENVRNNKPGLLLYSVTGAQAAPFQGGTLCVLAPIKRTPGQSAGGNAPPANDCSGRYELDLVAFAAGALGGNPLAALRVPGTNVYAQWWGRDQGFPAPNNTLLSDALQVQICP